MTTYVLKISEGMVKFLMRTGKDLVLSCMPEINARKIIEEGKASKPFDLAYPIAIDDTYFFEGKIVEEPEAKPAPKASRSRKK